MYCNMHLRYPKATREGSIQLPRWRAGKWMWRAGETKWWRVGKRVGRVEGDVFVCFVICLKVTMRPTI